MPTPTINSCSRLSAPQIKGKLSKGVTNRSVHSAIYLCNGLLKRNKLVNIMEGSLANPVAGICCFFFVFFMCKAEYEITARINIH